MSQSSKCGHPTGLAVGLRPRCSAHGPMTWFLEAERGMEGPPPDKLYQSLPSTSTAVCVSAQKVGVRELA